VHEGEFQAFHAKEPETGFLSPKAWLDLPKVLPHSERSGEQLSLFAPYIIKREGLYYMIYSPSPIRYAISKDLMNWEAKGRIFNDKHGSRDPSIFEYNGLYYIIYCTERKVGLRTSKDLVNWSAPKIIYESEDFDPESPSIIVKDDGFYLFMCAWDGVWDRKEVIGAYQHKTYVYYSTNVEDFFDREPITMLNAHAPEIFEHEGQWYISSVTWPERGVSIDKLEWK
jgi:beta-fructofuranosidase